MIPSSRTPVVAAAVRAMLLSIIWLSVTCPRSISGVKDLYEADIVLTDEDKHHVDQREEGDADGPGKGDVIKRNAVRNRQKLWKTRVVPYRISPALCKY
ncbi:hypothetical protein OS493_017841 [Desmophyllum pertusum]|uniref:Secreted protein n=1 Tax=Desmophyllum pertusum TaxID=174260 RepID=A0A9X0CR37_9CNID|nr:hypothetical protein OS493_017841 [Desmophyllum pertusum]